MSIYIVNSRFLEVASENKFEWHFQQFKHLSMNISFNKIKPTKMQFDKGFNEYLLLLNVTYISFFTTVIDVFLHFPLNNEHANCSNKKHI